MTPIESLLRNPPGKKVLEEIAKLDNIKISGYNDAIDQFSANLERMFGESK